MRKKLKSINLGNFSSGLDEFEKRITWTIAELNNEELCRIL